MAEKRTIGDYCRAHPVGRHHQKAGEKTATKRDPMSAGWAWNPDDETRKAIARGNRRLRKAKAAQLEGAKMATKKASSKKGSRKAAKKVTKKVAAKSNLIPLKKVCQKVKGTNKDPKMARRALRADKTMSKIHAAKGRWEFTAAQAKKAQAFLSA